MLDKLVFLVAECGLPSVPSVLQDKVPHYSLLKDIGKSGLTSAALYNDMPPEQLLSLYSAGKSAFAGKPSQQDVRGVISKLVYGHIQDNATLTMLERLELFSTVHSFSTASTSLVDEVPAKFSEIGEGGTSIVPSGFAPIDYVCGGLAPHTLTLMAAKTGHGKTSLLLAAADAIAKQHNKRVVFFTMEMLAKDVANRARFLSLRSNPDNLILPGRCAVADIEENANDNTIIVVDYPDLMLRSFGDSTRTDLATLYAELLRISKKTFMLLVASQLNRNEQITIDSLSESSAKGFFSEAIFAIIRGGSLVEHPGSNNVTFLCLKNRYSNSGDKAFFGFNYETLLLSTPPTQGQAIEYDNDLDF